MTITLQLVQRVADWSVQHPVELVLVLAVAYILWAVIRAEQSARKEKTQVASEPSPLAPLVQVYKRFEQRQTTPEGQSPYFKRKIRVVLQSISDETLEVEAPDWVTDVGDLAIQPRDQGPGAASGLRLENKHAGGWKGDKWSSDDVQRITVPAGHAFEVWVGLNHKYTDRNLEQHDREGKIGTLVLPVSIRGQRTVFRIRVTK